MQSVSSRIWTRVAVSISYDNYHYTSVIYIYIYNSDNDLTVNAFLIRKIFSVIYALQYKIG